MGSIFSCMPQSVILQGNSVYEIEGDCSICMSELNDGLTQGCAQEMHWFHRECLSTWIKVKLNADCPLCHGQIAYPLKTLRSLICLQNEMGALPHGIENLQVGNLARKFVWVVPVYGRLTKIGFVAINCLHWLAFGLLRTFLTLVSLINNISIGVILALGVIIVVIIPNTLIGLLLVCCVSAATPLVAFITRIALEKLTEKLQNVLSAIKPELTPCSIWKNNF